MSKTDSRVIIRSLAARLYDRAIMDNRERGDYAEELVSQALGKPWKWVGIGWHPWDFEGKVKGKRIRIQVKQSAALQVWRRPQDFQTIFLTEVKNKPRYVDPKIEMEDVGRFCEIFIFAWHGVDSTNCDQRDSTQWTFFVVPEKALGAMTRVSLGTLQSEWLEQAGGIETPWISLGKAVMQCIEKL